MYNYYFDSEWCDYIIYRYYYDSSFLCTNINLFFLTFFYYCFSFLSLLFVFSDLLLIIYWFLGGFYEKDFF